MFSSPCVFAQLVWHEFDVSDGTPWKKKIDGWEAEIMQREVDGASFKEDHLTISINKNGEKKSRILFTSSYGAGSISMKGPWIFLRYGVGRGTFAREEHLAIYRARVAGDLVEVANVKLSTFVHNPNSVADDPIHAEYEIKISEEALAMTIALIPPAFAANEMPEKFIKIHP